MANRTGKGTFKPGADSRRGKGGFREGAGRTPNWLKDACDQLLYEKGGVEKMGKMMAGEVVIITMPHPDNPKKKIKRYLVPDLKDIREATEFLADRAHGKPSQEIEHKGSLPVAQSTIIIKQAGQ